MKIKIAVFLSLFYFSLNLFSLVPDPYDTKYDWMDALIEKNFLPFKKGISLKKIEKTVNSHDRIVRLKVINNQVYAVKGQKGAGYAMLEYLAKTYGLPNLDILYFQQDGLWDAIAGGAPIFCSSKVKTVEQGLYFVDWYTKMPNPFWDDIVVSINQTLADLKWEQKRDQLVWRGVTSDCTYTPSDWKSGRRGKLCVLSMSFPELIDAKFVGLCPYTCQDCDELLKILPLGKFMSHQEQVQYKYQIIMDGLFSTFPGDRWRLLSNSVVFKHDSGFGHWFYDALIPWEHYIPVKSDLSDFLEKFMYIRSNDDLAKQLASNAREFALNFLMSEHIAVYCYKALLKYARLQKFRPAV